jgi:hypothetical protein
MLILAWAWGFAWLTITSLIAWPWVTGWWADVTQPEWRVMRWPLTVGLSLGLLTLWMLAVGFWQLNAWVALALPVVFLIGYRPGLHSGAWRALPQTLKSTLAQFSAALKQFGQGLLRGQATAWITLIGLALLAIVLGQATYYPFLGDDEISRYAYYARLMFVQGRVTDEVRGYPMFMPMAYAFVFFVTGQLAEQLARLIPVLLSAMTVVATGALGRRWFGARAGWAAALALMISPLYLSWSPNGYIDIPSALYFVLCAYAADVWQTKRQLRWAALAGLMAGLALWVKQAGFAALACLGLVVAWCLLRDLIKGRRVGMLAAGRDGIAAFGLAILAGGLWYLRNAYFDGWSAAVPGPGIFYYQQARPNLEYLIPFVGYFAVFGALASTLYLLGLGWGTLRLKRSAWALVWAVPYTLLWWQLFSYDARFLLTVLPFYALLFGGLVSEWRWPTPAGLRWSAIVLVLASIVWGVTDSRLGGLARWVIAPTASYAERLYWAKGPLYPTVEFVRDHLPATAHIVSMDGRLKYYLIDRSIDVSYPMSMDAVRQYDYFVVGSWWSSAYAGLGQANNEVTRALDDPHQLEPLYAAPESGLVVYRVVKP